jgi:hypothetical protein
VILEQMCKEEVERGGQHHSRWQSQHPGEDNVADRRHLEAEPLAAIVPATPEDSTCVVETGRPYMSAAAIVPAATSSAAAPCPYVRWVLPMRSPTVITMRFQPIIVPRPSAIATATLTQVGINLVALSSDCF